MQQRAIELLSIGRRGRRRGCGGRGELRDPGFSRKQDFRPPSALKTAPV